MYGMANMSWRTCAVIEKRNPIHRPVWHQLCSINVFLSTIAKGRISTTRSISISTNDSKSKYTVMCPHKYPVRPGLITKRGPLTWYPDPPSPCSAVTVSWSCRLCWRWSHWRCWGCRLGHKWYRKLKHSSMSAAFAVHDLYKIIFVRTHAQESHGTTVIIIKRIIWNLWSKLNIFIIIYTLKILS